MGGRLPKITASAFGKRKIKNRPEQPLSFGWVGLFRAGRGIKKSCMITYVTGNLMESRAGALCNTVNTVVVMGKGIALQFKMLFPRNYQVYRNACLGGQVRIGDRGDAVHEHRLHVARLQHRG